jgi:hypothetical protein
MPCDPQFVVDHEGLVGHPYWPDGSATSGVTLDVGDDLQFRTPESLRASWESYLAPADLDALVACCGLRGPAAGAAVQQVAHIVIPRAAALAVFSTDTLPRYEAQTVTAMRGADQLPDAAYTALVDLVFNRGTSLIGDQRLEMRAIAGAVAAFVATSLPDARAASLRAMVNQLHLMADRLWPVPSANRWDTILHARRLDEAALIAAVAVQLDPMTP